MTMQDNQNVLDTMIDEFNVQRPLLCERLIALPLLLAQPRERVHSWNDVP